MSNAGQVRLRASCRLSASAQTVWALIGDFAKPQEWLPGIRHVEMRGDVRVCKTAAGVFRERLTAMKPMSCRYTIERGPLLVSRYEAVLTLQPLSGECRASWECHFESTAVSDLNSPTRTIARIYDAGLRSLQARFGSDDPAPVFRVGKLANISLKTLLDSMKD